MSSFRRLPGWSHLQTLSPEDFAGPAYGYPNSSGTHREIRIFLAGIKQRDLQPGPTLSEGQKETQRAAVRGL